MHILRELQNIEVKLEVPSTFGFWAKDVISIRRCTAKTPLRQDRQRCSAHKVWSGRQSWWDGRWFEKDGSGHPRLFGRFVFGEAVWSRRLLEMATLVATTVRERYIYFIAQINRIERAVCQAASADAPSWGSTREEPLPIAIWNRGRRFDRLSAPTGQRAPRAPSCGSCGPWLGRDLR